MDTTSLFAGVILGSIGMGYLIYGKRQKKGMAFLSGVLLCAIPYFISNIFLLGLASAALMALPFFITY
jgi:hypothetical protein